MVGRLEPNSVPLLLLFQGGRRCEPLKQQEETALTHREKTSAHTGRTPVLTGSCSAQTIEAAVEHPNLTLLPSVHFRNDS